MVLFFTDQPSLLPPNIQVHSTPVDMKANDPAVGFLSNGIDRLCCLVRKYIAGRNLHFMLEINMALLTRITSTKVVPLKETTSKSVVQIVLWYLDSECSKHMTGNRSQLINFVHKFLGTVKFGNDHIAKIMGYGDYQMGNVTISGVYYVEGLGHNLVFVGQFCNSGLEWDKDEVGEHDLEDVTSLRNETGVMELYEVDVSSQLIELVMVVVKVVHECRHWMGGDDFGVDSFHVLRFHTCLIDILGFLEKFGWWFEQDIDGESEDDKQKKLVMVNEEGWIS
ncbi:hypothetical protein Tco_0972438 [Tanacetum coccineum]